MNNQGLVSEPKISFKSVDISLKVYFRVPVLIVQQVLNLATLNQFL